MLNLLLQERNYRFQVVWHLLCERSGRALARWEMWVTQYGNWYELIWCVSVCLFVWFVVIYRPSRECFTHMETSSLLVRGHGAVRVLLHSTPNEKGISVLTVSFKGNVTSLPVFNDQGLSRPGFKPRSPACGINALPLGLRRVGEFLTLTVFCSHKTVLLEKSTLDHTILEWPIFPVFIFLLTVS